jgi:hypothetical protein
MAQERMKNLCRKQTYKMWVVVFFLAEKSMKNIRRRAKDFQIIPFVVGALC